MESERLRNTLLAAMSHDVRTPLTALVGHAEALAASPRLDALDRSSADAISQEAHDLSALVNNLLEMARLESGQVDLRKDWQSVEEAVGSAIRSARHAIGNLIVQTDIPADLPLVEFDASLFERVLVNLFENVAKYGVKEVIEGVAAVISATVTPSTFSITVRDFGHGLPHSETGRDIDLFEKFTRGQTESNKRGVGLGLAICKAIVLAHHGQITATQAAGGGAEFTVTIPRGAPPAMPKPDMAELEE
jgi:two-component system sensor histidine kinase KdpD